MAAQGVDAGRGVQFGPGPVNNGKAIIATALRMKIPEKGVIVALATACRNPGCGTWPTRTCRSRCGSRTKAPAPTTSRSGSFQQQPWWGPSAI